MIFDIRNAQFGIFPIQLNKSTDVSDCSQLMVFCRYFTNTNIKKELLFCSGLKTNTKLMVVTEKISEFFKCENLKWENLCSVCSDGTPSILDVKNGLRCALSSTYPRIEKLVHCVQQQVSH